MKTKINIGLVMVIAILSLSFKPANHKKVNDWGQWFTPNSNYSGIQARVQKGDYNQYAHKWQWNVQIKNNYNRRATISFGYCPARACSSCSNNLLTILDPGKVDEGGQLLDESESICVSVGNVKF